MNLNRLLILVLLSMAVGCGQVPKKQTETADDTPKIQDTLIVKQENMVSESSPYAKSYSYYWIVGNDTLDFTLNVREWKKNETFYISVFHKKPMFFVDVLRKTDACLPLIKEYFEASELEWIGFRAPIFYLDLAKKLSDEYEHVFGRKNISQKTLNQFLLKSTLTAQLNDFLNPLNKKVKYYRFEKFFLIDKKDYKSYLPDMDIDFTEYSEFTFNAHIGITIGTENK